MNAVTTSPAPPGLAPDRTAEMVAAVLWFVDQLARQMFRRLAGHPRQAVAVEMHNYLRRCGRRFARVMERLAAGGVFRSRTSRAGQVRGERKTARLRLPREFAWVARLGEEVRMSAAMIGHHLNRTEVAAMIAACPQAQRVLRPMCHVLGIDAPCVPKLVRKRRVRNRAAEAPSPQPAPANAGQGVAKPRWLTRKEREAILWYPNLEGKPMKLLPKKLPRD